MPGGPPLYDGPTPTKFGRYHVAEPIQLDRLHIYDGTTTLREVDHEPPLPVLDQEDLFAQGIDTSELVHGAQRVDALGSCTCQAGTVSLAECLTRVHGKEALAKMVLPAASGEVAVSTTDPVASEQFAIVAYHDVTDQTGDPSQEWPPTDCGSTGLFVCQFFERKGMSKGHRHATGSQNIASLLQRGTVIQGTPWFYAWMQPDNNGFIDGDGSLDAFQAAASSGVAGGHETCLTAIEKIVLSGTGQVVPEQSVVRVRNSWSASFADQGSFRLHMSTLDFLAPYSDWKQFIV